MPIIKDPKMNHTESRYGVIEVNGIFCYYDKEGKENRKRFLPFGFEIPESKITITEPTDGDPIIIYNGEVIYLKANFKDGDITEEDINKQGKVTRGIYNHLFKEKKNKDIWEETDIYSL